MITVDMTQAKRLEKVLAQVRDRAVPYAQRNAINDTAFEARKQVIGGLADGFTIRNTWTARSVRVERATSATPSAVLGSTEEYMAKQEVGGKGKAYVPNPSASGESSRSRVRRRPIRQANWINQLTPARAPAVSGSQQEKNVVALKTAKAKGAKHVVMNKGRGPGIYRVLGTKRKPSARLLYSLRSAPVTIKPRPWLVPTAQRVQEQQGPSLYFAQLRQELRRVGR